LRGKTRINAALGAVTAAVVGVVLNLAVWFGGHVIWPEKGHLDGFAVVVGIASFIAMQWFKLNMILVILVSGLLGLAYHIL